VNVGLDMMKMLYRNYTQKPKTQKEIPRLN